MFDQPSGTVTLVFTDIEGSTRLLSEFGLERYRELLASHRSAVREAFARFQGYEVDCEGDSFFYAFASAADAVSAVSEAIANLAEGRVRIRVGVHTGEPGLDPPNYVGMDIHRAARIMAAAHGGQAVVSQTTRDLLDDAVQLRDLGEHRLKDLSAPVHLYQLGEGEFPPLRSLYRTNLPVPATAFLGRERELAEVLSLLRREQVRLVTLTGPGGTGKTRLALQAAAEAADDYPDGVWWVPLAPLRDARLVPLSIAEILQLRDEPGLAISTRLAEGLSGARMLVLLDNAEHLMPAIAEAIAELRAIEGPVFLITSRERLQLQGEQLYPVPALDDSDGVDLFVERARQLDPGFEETADVGELCERLEQLPLALELAAARTSLYTPAQLLERLRDRLDLLKAGRDSDPRQQTLRATIDWSYELLTSEEQRVYRAFSVFAGGSTLEAAEEVCGAAPDTLASLLDKSLLRRREASAGRRYWMLETIREHAAEHLARLGERPTLEESLAGFCLHFAEHAWRQLTTLGVEETVWFDRLLDERDNLRTALSYHRDRGDAEELARLCAAIWFIWYFRADAREGRQWLQAALDKGPPDDLRSAVENALAALILITSGDAAHDHALEIARAAIDHARARHDHLSEVMALITYGNILTQTDPTGAREARLSARRLAAEHNEPWWQLTASVVLAQDAASHGNWSNASDELEACRAIIDEHGRGSIHRLGSITAEVEWQLGNVVAARRHLTQALEEAQQNPLHAGYGELILAAEITAHDGDLQRAVELMSAARTLLSELGIVEDDFDIKRSAGIEALARERLGEDDWAAACERGRSLTLDEALLLALDSTSPAAG